MQLEVDLARCVRELDDDTWSLVRVEEASTAGVSGDTAGLGACRFEVDEVLHDLR